MFKPGEKIVCVIEDVDREKGNSKTFLKVHNIYTFDYYRRDRFKKFDIKNNYISIDEDTFTYHEERCFMSLKEYRKQKLKRICSEKEKM